MKKIIILLAFILFLTSVSAYEKHEPILIKDIHATAENPYIIEGYEISSDSANCIEVINSEHVIIRDNYLHNCNWSESPEESLSWTKGRAIVIKDSNNIQVEDNILLENKIGIFAYKTDKIKILNNDIRKTQLVGSLKCEYCNNSEISYNYLVDNGRPDWFWVPGNRIIGIWVAASNNMNIYNNTVIRSSSDGIGISGTIDSSLEEPGKRDWTTVSKNISVYNNLLLDNMELGIWLARISNMKCFNNTIRDHFGPIVLDFDVKDSEFYNNKLISWTGGAIGLGIAKDNYIHDNIEYSPEKRGFKIPQGDEPGKNNEKFEWSGITPYSSSGNIFENNIVRQIKGELKNALESKMHWAQEDKIFEEKGWFACEIAEGVVDEECVEKEVAKGNQGMPRELFVFEPLMENFDDFVIKEIKKQENAKTHEGDSIIDEIIESWKAALIIFLIVLILIFALVFYFKKYKHKHL